MPESQLIVKYQFIFDMLLDDLLFQCTIKSNFTGYNIIYVHACIDYLSVILIVIPDLRLLLSLENLRKELFDLIGNLAIFESWWQTEHLTWFKELNTTISHLRNIPSHHYDDLSNREIITLYYNANTFFIDCLDRQQKITIILCRKIEMALLSSEEELIRE